MPSCIFPTPIALMLACGPPTTGAGPLPSDAGVPCLDPEAWFADEDGDGYGDAGARVDACVAPSGYVSDATDCDDRDGARNPGMAEVCNGADDDCDGVADGPDSTDAGTWYPDPDDDGYGDPAGAVVDCEAPPGYLAQGGDCDEADPTVHPGAVEEDCLDGVDQNCDGDLYLGCPQQILVDADTRFYSVTEEEHLGQNLPPVAGDVDGDGYDDVLLVSRGGDSDYGWGWATAYLFLSPQPPGSTGVYNADTTWRGWTATFTFPNTASIVPDIDGDGLAEVLLGWPRGYSSWDGEVYLSLGPVTAGWIDPLEGTGRSDAVLTGEADDDQAGHAVFPAGDLDGDGTVDLVIAAPGSDGGATDAGKAYVYFGAPPGGTTSLAAADAAVVGEFDEQALGHMKGGADSDLDGDGLADLVLATSTADHGNEADDWVYVYLGPVGTGSRSAGSYDASYTARSSCDHDCDFFPLSVSSGDFDGDEKDDLTIGVSSWEADSGLPSGGAYVFRGPVEPGTWPIGDADVRLVGYPDDEYVSMAGESMDISTDPGGDPGKLLVGDSNYSSTGGAYLMRGSIADGEYDLAGADAILTWPAGPYESSSISLGSAVAFAGDSDGDGRQEMLLGAPHDGLYSSAGVVQLYLGSSLEP